MIYYDNLSNCVKSLDDGKDIFRRLFVMPLYPVVAGCFFIPGVSLLISHVCSIPYRVSAWRFSGAAVRHVSGFC